MIHVILPMAITKQSSLFSGVMYKKRVIQCIACAQLQTDHFLGSSAVNLKAITNSLPLSCPQFLLLHKLAINKHVGKMQCKHLQRSPVFKMCRQVTSLHHFLTHRREGAQNKELV